MKKILLAMALLILFGGILFAEMKIAYIDTDKIMMKSSDTQEAQGVLMTERKKWEQEITDIDIQIEELVNDYQSKQMILTESGKQEAEDKIQELSQTRQQKVVEYFGENGKFYQKQNELLEPILIKLKNVIEKIALDEDYTVVLDVSIGGILYAKPSLDITDQVIEELAKTVED